MRFRFSKCFLKRRPFFAMLYVPLSGSSLGIVLVVLTLMLASPAQAKKNRSPKQKHKKKVEMAVVVDEPLKKYLPILRTKLQEEAEKDLLSTSQTQEELEAAAFMGLRCEEKLASDVKCHARLAILLRSSFIFRLRLQKYDAKTLLVGEVFSSSEGEMQHAEYAVDGDMNYAIAFVVRALFVPSLLRGHVRIAAFPASYIGATLMVDDEVIGPLPLAQKIRPLALGTHRIQVVRKQVVFFSQEILVKMDAPILLSISEPSATPKPVPDVVLEQAEEAESTTQGSEALNWIPGVAVLGTGGASLAAGVALASWGQLELDGNSGTFAERSVVQNVGRVGLLVAVVGIGAMVTGGTLLGLEMVK